MARWIDENGQRIFYRLGRHPPNRPSTNWTRPAKDQVLFGNEKKKQKKNKRESRNKKMLRPTPNYRHSPRDAVNPPLPVFLHWLPIVFRRSINSTKHDDVHQRNQRGARLSICLPVFNIIGRTTTTTDILTVTGGKVSASRPRLHQRAKGE